MKNTFHPDVIFVGYPAMLQAVSVALVWVVWAHGIEPGWNMWPVIMVSVLASFSSFRPYVGREVTSVLGWFVIFFNMFALLLMFAFLHSAAGLCHSALDLQECLSIGEPSTFSTGLYFSVVTFTTLGYGDFHPIGYGRFFAVAEALIGYVFLGMTVAVAYHWADGVRQEN